MSRHRHLRAALIPLTLGAVPIAATAAIAASGGSDSSDLVVVNAERVPHPEKRVRVAKDRSAQSDRALVLEDKAAVGLEVSGQIERVILRVRGDRCKGTAKIRVRVNGEVVGTRRIPGGQRWRRRHFKIDDTAVGDHRIAVAFANPRVTSDCTRRLRIDWIGVRRASGSNELPAVESVGLGPLQTSAPLVVSGAVVDRDRPSKGEADTPPGPTTPTPAPAMTATPAPQAGAPAGGPLRPTPVTGPSAPAPAPAPSAPPRPAPSGPQAPFGTPVQARATQTASGVTRLWVEPGSPASEYASAWARSRPADAAQMRKLASAGSAEWLGNWSNDIGELRATLASAKQQSARAVVVAYGIPHRDAGQYSAGGHESSDDYRAFIDRIAATIGNRPTIVIVEPDAAAMMIAGQAQVERYALLRYAVSAFAKLPDTLVYLDAGNSGWRSPQEIVPRLKASGIDMADGFATNVSNYMRTNDEIAWGRQVSSALGGKHMIIDTSRNGQGPLPGATGERAWCNPPGRGIGSRPTMATGVAGVDAFVWAKRPGSSDGSCFGHPAAGTFMPERALELARNGTW